MSRLAAQYIVDNEGFKKSVIVPFDEWDRMNSNYQKLQNKLKVLLSIKHGVSEVYSAKNKNIQLQSLSEFLDECSKS